MDTPIVPEDNDDDQLNHADNPLEDEDFSLDDYELTIDEGEPDWEEMESGTSKPTFQKLHGKGGSEKIWVIESIPVAETIAALQPENVAVYGITDLGALPHNLGVVDETKVVIFPQWRVDIDDDTSGDTPRAALATYETAIAFADACLNEGAERAVFAQLHTESTLAQQIDPKPAEEQLKWLERLAAKAIKNQTRKPARTKPKAPTARDLAAQKAQVARSEAESEGRVMVNIRGDRQEVLNQLVEALRNGPDGERLYNFGGKLAQVVRDDNGALVAEFIDEGTLLNLLSAAAKMISITRDGVNDDWPESKTLTALFCRVDEFPVLRGIAPSPIVRADGSLATADGYDEATQVLLDLDGVKLDIPDAPTEADIEEATALLLDEWLADFPFNAEADKANVLALAMTYAVRELVSLVPLAVISAKSMGSGKSKLLGQIVSLWTRTSPDWDSLPEDDDETRKQITTLLLSAPSFLCFDESPVVKGRALNRLLTASKWSDRRLGRSERVSLDNRAVMASTGNNVQIVGDTGRRYYPIELYYKGENPENRSASEFKHADLEGWSAEHRGDLLTAVFTLIRAWQVAGCPERSTSFGSFERWEAVLGGILEVAGVKGFLDNLRGHRVQADFEGGLWLAHLRWLAQRFAVRGQSGFTSTEVVGASTGTETVGMTTRKIVLPDADLPPGLPDSTATGYTVSLGKSYTSEVDRWVDGICLRRSETKRNNKTIWYVELNAERAVDLAIVEGKDSMRANEWLSLVDRCGGQEAVARLKDAWNEAAASQMSIANAAYNATKASSAPGISQLPAAPPASVSSPPNETIEEKVARLKRENDQIRNLITPTTDN